jgi:undecaprenyl-diphosphatase
MEYVHAIILGIIEGLTEFLPVSSTGHLLIALPLLGIDAEQDATWRVFLFVCQFGAILAVIVYTWRDMWASTLRPRVTDWKNHLIVKLIIAMIPTVIIALTFEDFMERTFENAVVGPPATAIALIIGAGIIELIDRRYRREGAMTLDDITWRQAFWIGLIQTISMIPGTSRAGATIMGGMALGLTPRIATEFSFCLAIPTMLGASVLRLWKHRADLTQDALGVIAVGTAVSFVVALVVVVAFMRYVRKHRFTPFAIYRVVLGVAVLLYYYAGGYGD